MTIPRPLPAPASGRYHRAYGSPGKSEPSSCRVPPVLTCACRQRHGGVHIPTDTRFAEGSYRSEASFGKCGTCLVHANRAQRRRVHHSPSTSEQERRRETHHLGTRVRPDLVVHSRQRRPTPRACASASTPHAPRSSYMDRIRGTEALGDCHRAVSGAAGDCRRAVCDLQGIMRARPQQCTLMGQGEEGTPISACSTTALLKQDSYAMQQLSHTSRDFA